MFIQSFLFAVVVARGVYLVVAGAVGYFAAPNVLPKWPVRARAVFHDGVHTYFRALPWPVSNDPLRNSQRLLNLTHRLPVGCHIWTETRCGEHSFVPVTGMESHPDVPLYPSFPRPVLLGGGKAGRGGEGTDSDSDCSYEDADRPGAAGGEGLCVIRETHDAVWGDEGELTDVTDEVQPVYPQIMALPKPQRRLVLAEIGVLDKGSGRGAAGATVFALDQDMRRVDIA